MTWMLALACAASAGLHLGVVVPRLREPDPAPGEPPPGYARLGAPAHVTLLGVVVFALAQVLHLVPPQQVGVWFGYLGAGAALVWVDLRTTWLPRALTWVCGAQLALGLGWLALSDWRAALFSVAGAAGAFALFHLVWRASATFGYGDVRLAAIVGAVGGLRGLEGWLFALLCGTVVGAIWGVVHTLRRRGTDRPAHFPYGPSLWLGPIVAVAVSGW